MAQIPCITSRVCDASITVLSYKKRDSSRRSSRREPGCRSENCVPAVRAAEFLGVPALVITEKVVFLYGQGCDIVQFSWLAVGPPFLPKGNPGVDVCCTNRETSVIVASLGG